MEVVLDVARHYREEALERARPLPTISPTSCRLQEIASTLDAITKLRPADPARSHPAFLALPAPRQRQPSRAFRLDVSLGDFFARDIDAGRITEEQATEMLVALWRMFSENGADALCRIVLGGKGRRNPANADRFCMAAMEATRRHRRVTPQLTLRFDSQQDPKLLKKAYDVLAEGCCYPMLYNDDVVVPGVAKSMHLSLEDAQLFYPLGCGEYMVGWNSPSVLCCGWSIPKSLDAALHNGYANGRPRRPRDRNAPVSRHLREALRRLPRSRSVRGGHFGPRLSQGLR